MRAARSGRAGARDMAAVCVASGLLKKKKRVVGNDAPQA